MWLPFCISWGGGGGGLRSLVHSTRTGFILGCENWDRNIFKALVKSFVLLIWATRKNKLYGDWDGVVALNCPLTGDLTISACVVAWSPTLHICYTFSFNCILHRTRCVCAKCENSGPKIAFMSSALVYFVCLLRPNLYYYYLSPFN